MGTRQEIKMPELLVFAKLFAGGFIIAEVWRVAVYLGVNAAPSVVATLPPLVIFAGIMLVAILCCTYALKRRAHQVVGRMCRSGRIDLLTFFCIGLFTNYVASPWLVKVHTALQNSNPNWTSVVFFLLCAILLSPLMQPRLGRSKKSSPQLTFISDKEIQNENEDVFARRSQIEAFAKTVLASAAHQGLVFAVDGPWGIGKTSFINLAERYWMDAKDSVIVCRFELLRYASEIDITDRLVRELCAAIQREVFAPEFRPAASRYSRLIKGKTDVSFLGFKLTLEPSQESVDELLEDIDDALRRIGRRVIIVLDDLDRLDAKTVNNVLFATRRTLKLSQATYILCFDTELLVRSGDEGSKAREFLEKFVTVKLSLFIDSSIIRDYLRKDWRSAETRLGAIPSDTIIKLGELLNEVADILDGDLAASYLSLLGDLRKVKRFVNALLLRQLHQVDLGRTDFNNRDIIHLMLLHMRYPGLFRRIYAEESEGRSGIFSVRRPAGEQDYQNSVRFTEFVKQQEETAAFLLNQLFDVKTLKLGAAVVLDEEVLTSRACFNDDFVRNLQSYLELIVRFTAPEPQETFVLYQQAVLRVRNGASVNQILTSHEFQSNRWEHAHDQFWRVLVNQCHDFTDTVAEDSIDTLLRYLPSYPMIAEGDLSLRQRSILNLLRLLDDAGWGRTKNRRRPNTSENIQEITWRIFGESKHQGRGIIARLTSSDRGVLGWNDLMIFRLYCCADRQGQLHNLYSALIVDDDINAERSGLTSIITLKGMRKLSQTVFAAFKREYMDPKRNFYADVRNAPTERFLGEGPKQSTSVMSIEDKISAARNTIQSFVIYQLSNSLKATGSGVGCGCYDESGYGDGGGIANLMNEYVFHFCFNPTVDEDNIFFFLDHCVSHLNRSFFSAGQTEDFPSKTELPGGFDPLEMGRYWISHRDIIRQRNLHLEERYVVTANGRVSYSEKLIGIFEVLDELAKDATKPQPEAVP